MRTLTTCLLASALVVVTACSGDDGGDNTPPPDASPDGPPAGTCGTPAGTISTFPGMANGTTTGGANHFTVAEGACADEASWYDPVGNDASIALTGLTAGQVYVVTLTSTTDMSLYIASTCDAAGPASGACLAFRDVTTTGEELAFVAPASGSVYAIVDAFNTSEAGDFTVAVRTGDCIDDAGCSGATPHCVDYACAQCASSFDCTTAGAPVCDTTGTCVAGAGTCTGDTAGEPDNGPAAARALTYPTPTTPTTVMAGICGTANGDDWYKVTATAAGTLRVAATWTATADLDFRVYDAAGAAVASGISTNAQDETRLVALPAAGTYYLQLHQYTASSGTPSNDLVAYTLTLAIPECTTDFQCTMSGAPVCNTTTGTCGAGPDMCTGDVGEPDDGPAAARELTGAVGTAVQLSGAICNTPAAEADWYKVTVASGQGLTISTTFDAANDLDVAVFDATGRLEGLTFWKNPEVINLTYLPAGTHYVRVVAFAQTAFAAAVTYTISATRSVAQTCATRTDCAATFDTQLYRGNCTAGACQFIPAGAGAEGAPCDSPDDCTGGSCSYIVFEADAQKSVCSKACTTNADCASLGSGYTCTTGFQSNICVPSCTADRECGADTQTTPTGTDPWAYWTCTSGVCGA